MKNKASGFTLVELLVSIFLITLLAGIAIPSITTFRAKSRDATRVAHIDAIISAAAAYRLENGRFPCSAPTDSMSSGFLNELVSNGYLKEAPRDPLNDAVDHNGHAYGYATFKNTPSGTCGQILHIEVAFERPSQCPHGQFSGGSMFNSGHCHVFFPRTPDANPATCPDPWHFTTPIGPGNCGDISD